MFAVATAFLTVTDDMPGLPTLKRHSNHSFVVRNIFTDFKRHDLGLNFHERNYEGTLSTLFITEPLWGVGTTAPYGHDGRSDTLEDVILRHGGEAARRRAMPSPRSPRRRRASSSTSSSRWSCSRPTTRRRALQPINPAAAELPAERARRHRADAAVQQHGGSGVGEPSMQQTPGRLLEAPVRGSSGSSRACRLALGATAIWLARPGAASSESRTAWRGKRRRRPRPARGALAELLAKVRLEAGSDGLRSGARREGRPGGARRAGQRLCRLGFAR